MPRLSRIAPRAIVACGLLGLIGLPHAHPAQASAKLVRCTIKPGQVFTHGYPRVITGVFDEVFYPDTSVSFIHVFHATGKRTRVDMPPNVYTQGHRAIQVRLPAGLKGVFKVVWADVEMDDGHRATGSFTFTIR